MSDEKKDMKPRTTVRELERNLLELRRLAHEDTTLHPEFVKGYVHLLDQVVRWCRDEGKVDVALLKRMLSNAPRQMRGDN